MLTVKMKVYWISRDISQIIKLFLLIGKCSRKLFMKKWVHRRKVDNFAHNVICSFRNVLTAWCTVPRNGQNTKNIAQARHHIFLKRVYPRVSENGKKKMVHFYQKEKNHKTSHYLMRFEPNWKKIPQNSGKRIWIAKGL